LDPTSHPKLVQLSILEVLQDAAFLVDTQGVILYTNQAAEFLFKANSWSLVGNRITNLVPDMMRTLPGARRRTALRPRLQSVREPNPPIFAAGRDRQQFPIGYGLFPVASSTGPAILALLLESKGDKKSPDSIEPMGSSGHFGYKNRILMEQILELLAPLPSIELERNQKQLLGDLMESAHALRLAFSRIRSTPSYSEWKAQQYQVCFDFYSSIHTISRLIAIPSDILRLGFSAEIDPSIPAMVHGNPNSLTGIHIILAGNLLRRKNLQGISLQASTEKQTRTQTTIRVLISSQITGGFSVPEQEARQVPRLAGNGGESAGLEPVRRLVASMGGRLSLNDDMESSPAFSFTVKMKTMPQPHPPGQTAAPGLAGTRILLVENDPVSRNRIRSMLEGLGCTVKTGSTGAEAMPSLIRGTLANAPSKIVLLDDRIPGMPPELVLQAIRQDKATANTRVVLLLTMGASLDAAKVRETGYDGCLLKPVRVDHLSARLQALLASAAGGTPDPQSAGFQHKLLNREPIILLAEDDELNQQLAKILFARSGFKIDLAFTGADAVAAVKKKDYNLVFMDIEMPLMNGFTAAKRIRSMRKGRNDPLIIAMTAHSPGENRQKYLEAGMVDSMTKPLGLEKIANVIANFHSGKYEQGVYDPGPPEPRKRQQKRLPLDPSIGLPVFDNDPVVYGEFLAEFIAGMPDRINNLEIAFGTQNWEMLVNEAHKLKGISANLGAMELSYLAGELDIIARERTGDRVPGYFRKIKKATARLAETSTNAHPG